MFNSPEGSTSHCSLSSSWLTFFLSLSTLLTLLTIACWGYVGFFIKPAQQATDLLGSIAVGITNLGIVLGFTISYLISQISLLSIPASTLWNIKKYRTFWTVLALPLVWVASAVFYILVVLPIIENVTSRELSSTLNTTMILAGFISFCWLFLVPMFLVSPRPFYKFKITAFILTHVSILLLTLFLFFVPPVTSPPIKFTLLIFILLTLHGSHALLGFEYSGASKQTWLRHLAFWVQMLFGITVISVVLTHPFLRELLY